MKKRFLVFIVAIITVVCAAFAGTIGLARAEDAPESAYDFYKKYATEYSLRSVYDGGELIAATYLSATLVDFGYTTESQQFSYAETVYENSVQKDYKYTVKNVVAKKAATTDTNKTLIIGAYYGGFAQEQDTNMGEGAEIATSVGLTLEIAKRLSTVNLPYNIIVVFFGGYEIGGNYATSAFFAACGVKTSDMLCYINIDSVGAGTYDYVYYDDVPTTQGKYFDNVIAKLKAKVKSAPIYKKPNSMQQDGVSLQYSHLGNLGLNAYFMDRAVPSVSFIGGNWEQDVGLHRYTKGSVIGTELDTVEEIDSRNGGAAKTAERLDSVASIVVAAALGADFSSQMIKARDDITGAKLASHTIYVIILVVGAIAFIAALVVYYTRLRNARKGLTDLPTDSELYIKQNGQQVSGENDGVFEEFSGEEKKSEEDISNDDVFRF